MLLYLMINLRSPSLKLINAGSDLNSQMALSIPAMRLGLEFHR